MFGFFRPRKVPKLDIGAEKVMKKPCILSNVVLKDEVSDQILLHLVYDLSEENTSGNNDCIMAAQIRNPGFAKLYFLKPQNRVCCLTN